MYRGKNELYREVLKSLIYSTVCGLCVFIKEKNIMKKNKEKKEKKRPKNAKKRIKKNIVER
jgi:hypothetical protein